MPGFHDASRRSHVLRALATAGILCTAGSHLVAAHELELTEVHVTFNNNGTYRIEVMNDPDWLLMRVEPFSGLELSGRLDPEQRDRRLVEMETTFAEWVHLFFDGTRADIAATYLAPTADGPAAPDETWLGTMPDNQAKAESLPTPRHAEAFNAISINSLVVKTVWKPLRV